jgi:hypothetical protein
VNLLKTPLRRTAAAVVGTLIGLSGAFAFAGPASAHTPTLKGNSSCTDTGWKVDWVLTTKDTFGKVGTLHNVHSSGGSALTVFKDNATVQPDGGLTETQQFTKNDDHADLTFKITWTDGAKADAKPWPPVKAPYHCNYPTPSHSPSPSPSPSPSHSPSASPSPSASTAKPTPTPTETPTLPPAAGNAKPIFNEDCTTITLGLDNPANGVEITLKFKTSKGEERTDIIKPGEAKSEKFSAVPGFTVDLTFSAKNENTDTLTVPYTKPAGCNANGNGGGLPVTGAAAGTIAGGAALLLIVGGVLFVMARRRKVKFTA